MTFKPAIWFPITVALTVINVVGIWFAAQSAEALHATVHGALGVGFGLWAWRLRSGPRAGGGERPTGFEALEGEVSRLRQELTETQERLDFFERLLARGQQARRVDPQQER
jgi:hypothetical protein